MVLARLRSALVALAVTLVVAAAALVACGGHGGGEASPATRAGGSSGSPRARSVLTDLAYAGVSPAQKLDLHLPATGRPPYPVIVFIHGGGFLYGNKRDGQAAPALEGLRRGYAVASIDYRLSPEAKFPAQIEDVKSSIRWLRANAAKYRLDPARIAVWGSSAGGDLAALAGTSGDVARLAGLRPANAGYSDRVQAVVDWYGPISFLKTDQDFRAGGRGPANYDAAGSFLSRYLGAALPTVPGRVRAADPTTYITPGDPPFFIEHGTADGTVPVRQSTRFAAALARVLGRDQVSLRLLPGAGHADAAFFTRENVGRILDWLDGRLK
jgi:acetyl esterase/lipase